MKEIKAGDVLAYIYGMPGPDITYLLVRSVEGTQVSTYDVIFEIPVVFDSSKRSWTHATENMMKERINHLGRPTTIGQLVEEARERL